MPEFSYDDLDIEWQMWSKPATAGDNDQYKHDFHVSQKTPYKNFSYFQRSSWLQMGVPLSHVQSATLRFRGTARLTKEPKLASNWQCGWLQSIRKASHTGTYSGHQKLYQKIDPLPVRDAEDDAWPFSDSPKDLSKVGETYKVRSEDAPMHYFPITFPGTTDSRLVSSTGELDFLTVFACYRAVDNCLIALGGYKWVIDFGASYDFDGDIKWRPNGTGLALTALAHEPSIVKLQGRGISTQLWGAERLSLSNDTAFDRMKESFSGINWVAMSDHTDDEGDKGTSWAPGKG